MLGPQGWHIYLGCCFKSLGNRDEAGPLFGQSQVWQYNRGLKFNLVKVKELCSVPGLFLRSARSCWSRAELLYDAALANITSGR